MTETIPLGGSINTYADVVLFQRFANYYSDKVWKNALLFVHYNVQTMNFEFVLEILELLF